MCITHCSYGMDAWAMNIVSNRVNSVPAHSVVVKHDNHNVIHVATVKDQNTLSSWQNDYKYTRMSPVPLAF